MKTRILRGLITLIFIFLAQGSFSLEPSQPKVKIKPALVVIDIQKAFLKMMDVKEKETAMAGINAYIEVFRSYGFPVVRVYHQSKEYGVLPGNDEFEFPETVLIKPGDAKVIKTYPDGFNKTDLDSVLREKGVNTLFLCGLSSVGCVLATWIGAFNHDYKAFLLKDAIMSPNETYTHNVEMMFDAVGYETVKLILDTSEN